MNDPRTAGASATETPGHRAKESRDNPYPGLRPFAEGESALFFGREAVVERLVEQLSRRPFVVLVGPAGIGKTSVVQAGVTPRLRSGIDGETWRVETLRPGERPLHSLAAALLSLPVPAIAEADRRAEAGKLAREMASSPRKLADSIREGLVGRDGTSRLLLVVDPWEALYGSAVAAEERGAFIGQLLTAADGKMLNVLLVMRSDWRGRIVSRHDLAEPQHWAKLSLGPMSSSELAEAIRRPAQIAGSEVEMALVDRLAEEVDTQPGSLPLLQLVLHELWDKHDGARLTLEDYRAIGGSSEVLSRLAEQAFSELGEPERAIARRLFLRLVRVGPDVPRRIEVGSLEPEERRVAEGLVHARLLFMQSESEGAATIEIAHEALIRGWPRLSGWLEAHRAEIGGPGIRAASASIRSQGGAVTPGITEMPQRGRAALAGRLRAGLQRAWSRWVPRSVADLDRLPTSLLLVSGLVPAALLGWWVLRSPLATAGLVLLLPVAALWQGRRVRVVWERGIPPEAEISVPLRRPSVGVEFAAADEEIAAEPSATSEPRPPYPLQDPVIEMMALPGNHF